MDLGFVFILSEVLKKAGPGKQKGKKKGEKKKNKFVADVLMDINRFLEYKKKMIGFWYIKAFSLPTETTMVKDSLSVVSCRNSLIVVSTNTNISKRSRTRLFAKSVDADRGIRFLRNGPGYFLHNIWSQH